MKRSLNVTAPLLAATALALSTAACRKPEMQRCVDEKNRVVADNLCTTSGQQPVRNSTGGFFYPYRYYYGGYGGYGLGATVGGGAYNAIPGRSYANSASANSSTSRGGFGSTHSSSGESGGGYGGGGE